MSQRCSSCLLSCRKDATIAAGGKRLQDGTLLNFLRGRTQGGEGILTMGTAVLGEGCGVVNQVYGVIEDSGEWLPPSEPLFGLLLHSLPLRVCQGFCSGPVSAVPYT